MYRLTNLLFISVFLLQGCGTDLGSFDTTPEKEVPLEEQNWSDIRMLPDEEKENIEFERKPGELADELAKDPQFGLSFQLQNTDELFCPEGYKIDPALRLCTSSTEAIGPFPEAMRQSCRTFGGGQACENDNWNLQFTRNLRGNDFCPKGTVRLAQNLCSDGANAYGPFPIEAVKNCEKQEGGQACYSLRWNLNFAKSLMPKSTQVLAGHSIALDVGHGNHGPCSCFDPGAVNQFQIKDQTEYVINLKIATKVRDYLTSLGAEVKFLNYTKGSSYFPSLYQRGVNARGNDIFLSIHHNASVSHSAQGSEVFTVKNNTAKDRKLADLIQKQLVKNLWNGSSNRDRGVKKINWPILRGAASGVQAKVLVEGFFMDLPSISRSNLDVMIEKESTAISEAIVMYFNN